MTEEEDCAPDAPRPEVQTHTKTGPGNKQGKSAAKPQKIPLHQIYALPAPLRTFPLPSFYPNNPLSLFHVLWAWASQVLSPPPAEPSVIHQGYWSPETQSVHIRDPKSIRALWEQGFFGKGNYSRSEPNWLKREQSRQGEGDKRVSELITTQRREERKMMKWDRARKEQDAILKTRLEEAWVAPVGPKELLALPNSLRDLHLSLSGGLTNGLPTIDSPPTPEPSPNGNHAGKAGTVPFPVLNGAPLSPPTTPITKRATPSTDGITLTPKRRKSVRFSPNVESTTFQLFDPPSPHLGSSTNSKASNGSVINQNVSLPEMIDVGSVKVSSPNSTQTSSPSQGGSPEPADREHLQLSPEEAFYLVFALGALSVTDPITSSALTTQELFQTFRQLSCSPSSTTLLRPDDPFLVQYAVYHHFRSLGWVPRSGIKFGVDWLLYMGGPVFSHAEFAVTVLPAYTHPYWKSHGHPPQNRSWHWLHSVNRVQSHALKTMVLVYVDIPPPSQPSDPSTLLKGYKIREFLMKRWLSNRSR
ncbi:putative tRNA-splicing endonuclease subunit [Rosellinia necatrix]|uniref:tRNA-intron lyase n=1 Tax=Rosellinia necatrix TaxID=77044 RepID=A0A1W2TR72_ROSNE|nr:putative tRNA-splicing endonuclease subunit [Rosellinia necatrix]